MRVPPFAVTTQGRALHRRHCKYVLDAAMDSGGIAPLTRVAARSWLARPGRRTCGECRPVLLDIINGGSDDAGTEQQRSNG